VEINLIVCLLEPKIPPNTGNIARLCAANNLRLEIVGDIGFSLSDKDLKRAGLDYWKYVNWEYFPDLDGYMKRLENETVHLFTTKSDQRYTLREFKSNDYLIFGSETKGIPDRFLKANLVDCCTIPMANKNIRSLNLSSSVSIAVYEALRQQEQGESSNRDDKLG